jgi:hypothetical protein
MTETCTSLIDRDERLVGYLYDDIDPSSRAAFEAHMASCAVCRDEVRALQGVREKLAGWTLGGLESSVPAHQSAIAGRRTPTVERPTAWRHLPAWAQVAAASLFLGAAAGLANLNVHYDASGLSVRTGWMRPASAPPASSATVAAPSDSGGGVSRADLVALEQRLRGELRAIQTSAHAASADTGPATRAAVDVDLVRRIRGLVGESEKRQQRELALRIGEALRDVSTQRQADLVRIDRSLGLVQNNLGVEVLKQRERVNYLMRVNQAVPVR